MEDPDIIFERNWPLHALARDYSAGEKLDNKAWFDRCCKLIEQGVDPLAKCDGGAFVWNLLSPPGNAPWEYAPRLLAILMERGFNPLISYEGSDPFLVNELNGALALSVSQAMVEQMLGKCVDLESSNPVRDENGGNVLHMVCHKGPEHLSNIVELKLPLHDQGLPRSWFNAEDATGATPMDILWAPGGKWDRLEQETDEGQIEIDTSILLSATGYLVVNGADIARSHSSGKSMGAYIYEKIMAHPEAREQIKGEPLEAMLQSVFLEEVVPFSTRSRPGLRI